MSSATTAETPNPAKHEALEMLSKVRTLTGWALASEVDSFMERGRFAIEAMAAELDLANAARDEALKQRDELARGYASLKAELEGAFERLAQVSEELEAERSESYADVAELGRVLGALKSAGIDAEWVEGEMLTKTSPAEGVEKLAADRGRHRDLYDGVYQLLKGCDVYGTGGDASSCAREVLMQLSEARTALDERIRDRDRHLKMRGELVAALADLLELNDARSKRLFDDETWEPVRALLAIARLERSGE